MPHDIVLTDITGQSINHHHQRLVVQMFVMNQTAIILRVIGMTANLFHRLQRRDLFIIVTLRVVHLLRVPGPPFI